MCLSFYLFPPPHNQIASSRFLPQYGLDIKMRLPSSVVHIDCCLASHTLDNYNLVLAIFGNRLCVGSCITRNPSAGVRSIKARAVSQFGTDYISQLELRRLEIAMADTTLTTNVCPAPFLPQSGFASTGGCTSLNLIF